eukprot:TRINITY_DN112123_c0_g1_i1.p1 TRINITY_DN112123_c0_g1~~TRINITY_DN112123_c0_g1_i1.p1  ORF type:complete len:410 (+),score=88.58 TRINITY_DN112123_c0_g1_i1:80-1309(+)
MESNSLAFDFSGFALLVGVLVTSSKNFWFRGITYRPTVQPLAQERAVKAALYLGIICVLDAVARRGGALVAKLLGMQAGGSTRSLVLRALCIWLPVAGWVISGPMRHTSRDDSGFSVAVQKWGVWRWLREWLFPGSRMILAEEWKSLTKEQVRAWHATEEPVLIPMHPHGILPMGGIINGLTWASGGIQAVTPSGAEIEKPASPGKGLHQSFFTNMQLRCAVASGVFLPPFFFEAYRGLGAVECTKPFIVNLLRRGRAVALYPGGATESRFATPGRYVVYVKNRKGFVRVALEERVHLMPLYTFGDEAIIPQPWNCPEWFCKLQDMVKAATGLLAPPLATGPPKRIPLTTLVGVPIDLSDLWVKEVGDKASDEAVDKAHARYMEYLQKMFDANKKFVPGGHEKAVLEFL